MVWLPIAADLSILWRAKHQAHGVLEKWLEALSIIDCALTMLMVYYGRTR